MRLDKLKNQLDLILLLVDNRDFTIDELCNKIDISRRNLYYLIDFLKHAGFTLYKRKGCYHIDYHSPFIANLLHSVQFTDNEIRAIYDVLNLSGINNETTALIMLITYQVLTTPLFASRLIIILKLSYKL